MMLAIMPPFSMWATAAEWCPPGFHVQTDSSPDQKLLMCSPDSFVGEQPQQWLPTIWSWNAISIFSPSVGAFIVDTNGARSLDVYAGAALSFNGTYV
jgi:hypothetical protein